MRSRFIINLALLVFIIGTTIFLSVTDKEPETPTKILISDINPETIDQIIIDRKDTGSIEFQKDNGQWSMQSPYTALANPARIKSILNILTAESRHQLDAGDVELERLLLADPTVRLKLNQSEFSFGDVNPLDKNRYVLHNDQIHLIYDNLYHQLLTNATFFLDNKLLPVDTEPRAIQYPLYRLEKQGEEWVFVGNLDLSTETLTELVQTWQRIQANSVQEYQPLDPLYNITLEFDDHEPITFAVISDLPNLILARPEQNLQYQVSESLAEKLFPKQNEDIDTSEGNPEGQQANE